MSRRKLHIGVLTACVVLLLGLAVTYLHERPPLLYHIQLIRWHELPTRLIRPAFQHIVNRDLPPKANGLRALFQGGREPKIYVRFETDSDGIAYIHETFGKSGAKWEAFDAEKLCSGREVFTALSVVQRKAGVCLFDQDSIKSGRLLMGRFDRLMGRLYKYRKSTPLKSSHHQ